MRSQAALNEFDSKDGAALYIAMDVGDQRWELGLTDGHGTIKTKSMEAGQFDELDEHLEWAEEYFDLDGDYQIASCYEAGRDGFWIHRVLEQRGIACGVIDPGSLREEKKGPRAKTDRIDAEKLAVELVRWCDGHRDHGLNVIRVPGPEDEDDRHLFRERCDLVDRRISLTNQIESLLKTQGIDEMPAAGSEAFADWVEGASTADGRPLGKRLTRRLKRINRRLRQVREDIDEVEKERSAYLRGEGRQDNIEKARMLAGLRGIGELTAHALVVELFGWREFQNRREIGAFVGMDGKRHDSGETEKDGAITRKGDARIRKLVIQLARNWLRFQSETELARWARRRFGDEDGGVSNRGVVALGRKLLNRLRVLLEDGVLPHGARFEIQDFDD